MMHSLDGEVAGGALVELLLTVVQGAVLCCHLILVVPADIPQPEHSPVKHCFVINRICHLILTKYKVCPGTQ